uniref:B-cell lymphoma 3 protein-like n=1 Tax=Pristiophorus japonicus TaxID=55135 RepID=UPI00398EEE38
MEGHVCPGPLDLRLHKCEPLLKPRAAEQGEHPGARKAERARLSLPPRKRPYPAAAEGRPDTPAPAKAAATADSPGPRPPEPVRLKTEPVERLVYCGGSGRLLGPNLAPANGYSYLEPVYVPVGLRQLPYYPGVNKSYLGPSFPICPVPTHPIAMGALPAFHTTPCPVLCAREDILASDIAMATRQDEDGDTPLHIAVVQEDATMVQKLIQLLLLGKKDLDIYNNLRQTPLHLAVITKQSSVAGQLVANGACRGLLDRNGQTAIHLACEHSSLECLVSLLGSSQETIDLEIRNYEGYTPLHVAVNSRHKEIVSHLLDRGADVDAVDIKSGRTPLVHAVENNCMEMVVLLLQHGANVNLQTYSGNTALHSSSGRGLMEIVKVLLKNGADSSIKNCHNDTSLMVAKNKKVIDVLRGKASRTGPLPLPSPRTTGATKDWDSPSSKPSSPLPAPHGSCCPSPSVQQTGTPGHASSPPRGPASSRSPASPCSAGQRSPRPEVQARHEEPSAGGRGAPCVQWEAAERCARLPRPHPPLLHQGLLGHPRVGYALPPSVHARHPAPAQPGRTFGTLPPSAQPDGRSAGRRPGLHEWGGETGGADRATLPAWNGHRSNASRPGAHRAGHGDS